MIKKTLIFNVSKHVYHIIIKSLALQGIGALRAPSAGRLDHNMPVRGRVRMRREVMKDKRRIALHLAPEELVSCVKPWANT